MTRRTFQLVGGKPWRSWCRSFALAGHAMAWAAVATLSLATPLTAQEALRVEVHGGAARDFGRADLERLAIDTLRIAAGHAPIATYRVVSMARLLSAVGVPLDSLHGGDFRRVVVAEGRDGYAATFTLGELSPAVGGREVWIVVGKDGAPLAAAEGPWRLLVPGDGRGARAVRQLRLLRVVRVDGDAPPQRSQRSSPSATNASSRSHG